MAEVLLVSEYWTVKGWPRVLTLQAVPRVLTVKGDPRILTIVGHN